MSAKFLTKRPGFIKRKQSRGKFATGVRYERQAVEYLALLALGRPGVKLLEKQWVNFFDENGKRWCEIDALLIDRNCKQAIIYEVKYQHCVEAWFQLRELYFPVVQKLLPDYTIGLMEVVHWHDPQVEFPQAYDLTDSPLRVPRSNKVAVFIFNPRRAGSTRSRLADSGHNGGQGDGETAGGSGHEEGSARHDDTPCSPGGGVVQPGCSEVPAGAEGKAQ